MFAAYCTAVDELATATAEYSSVGRWYQPFVTFDEDGHLVEPDDPKARRAAATIREHPSYKAAERKMALLLRLPADLGLTSAARSRVSATAIGHDDGDESGLDVI